jgi:hypothetical protein
VGLGKWNGGAAEEVGEVTRETKLIVAFGAAAFSSHCGFCGGALPCALDLAGAECSAGVVSGGKSVAKNYGSVGGCRIVGVAELQR